MSTTSRTAVVAVVACLAGNAAARADILFADSFDRAPSPMWGNEVGEWVVVRGTYSATIPSNFPNSHSSLPFALGDFAIELDVNDIADGGVWLHSVEMPGTAVGRAGVLLVTGGSGGSGTGLYWHICDGQSYGGALNGVSGLFVPGQSDPHLRIEVEGSTYSVFVDGSDEPATTLETSAYPSGQVALYDFSNQTFDNVVIMTLESTSCPADLDGDGVVGAADLAILLGGWGQAGASDLNGDRATDGADLAILLGAWGPC